MPELAVTVRDLAAFCHRSGDIDYRFRPSPTGVQGTEGHQRVYRNRPETYQSEYSVTYRVGNELLVRGRADGYDPRAGLVEEIKTCRVRPESIPASVTTLHMAQLLASLSMQKKPSTISWSTRLYLLNCIWRKLSILPKKSQQCLQLLCKWLKNL